QAPKREVTAVAVGPDGSLYAAAVGAKSTTPPLAVPVPAPAPAPAPPAGNVVVLGGA
ncbi:MAG TPA: signal recognition particle-docking protein FtsY, partial [Solibacterales bacterium]|nr:signal recognition particle-docking protein FtsY [Bryobacterales bacterium]